MLKLILSYAGQDIRRRICCNLLCMIPEFPKFKNLELSDEEDVGIFTKKFPPYADELNNKFF